MLRLRQLRRNSSNAMLSSANLYLNQNPPTNRLESLRQSRDDYQRFTIVIQQKSAVDNSNESPLHGRLPILPKCFLWMNPWGRWI